MKRHFLNFGLLIFLLIFTSCASHSAIVAPTITPKVTPTKTCEAMESLPAYRMNTYFVESDPPTDSYEKILAMGQAECAIVAGDHQASYRGLMITFQMCNPYFYYLNERYVTGGPTEIVDVIDGDRTIGWIYLAEEKISGLGGIDLGPVMPYIDIDSAKNFADLRGYKVDFETGLGEGIEEIDQELALISDDNTSSVNPKSSSLQLTSGETHTLKFTLTTAETPPELVDILFLFDVSGSMGAVLDEAKENGVQIMDTLASSYPDIAFGVGSFSDFNLEGYGDEFDYPWRLDQDLTSSIAQNASVINELTLLSGEDIPESILTSLWNATEIYWRVDARKIIVLFSDAPVHDPNFYSAVSEDYYGIDPGPDGLLDTEDDLRMETTIEKLSKSGISVFPIYASPEPNEVVQYGFDAIADQTGGKVFNLENASQLSQVLVDDLGDSIKSIGILSTKVNLPNTEDLTIIITPEQYTQVQGGENRTFSIEISAGEKITQPIDTLAKLVFFADENPIASADIAIKISADENSLSSGQPTPEIFTHVEQNQNNPVWWWILGVIILAGALIYFRKPILTALRNEKRFILIHRQENRETRFNIHDGFLIGSESHCDLILDRPGVDGIHARLRISDKKWLVTSPNGQENIGLNGQQIDAAVVRPGDKIQLGDTLVEFQVERGSKGEKAEIHTPERESLEHTAKLKLYWDRLSRWVTRLNKFWWIVLAFVVVLMLILFWPDLHRESEKAAPEQAEDLNLELTMTPMQTETRLPTMTPTESPGIGSTLKNDKDGAEMVYVPEGEFLMGSEDGDSNESPEHTVYLDAYWIYKYEVTNAQFTAFLNAQGNLSEGGVILSDLFNENAYITQSGDEWVAGSGYEDLPVVDVSWHGAQAYCDWTGGRLPTEAEWEKAARGTDGRTYPWGEEDPTCSLANFSGCEDGTVPVGSFPNGASPYGALDMAGNVWDWVLDWYDPDYYASSPNNNPIGPGETREKVLRGGSWLKNEESLRASSRLMFNPGYMNRTFSFRCVLSPSTLTTTQDQESIPILLSEGMPVINDSTAIWYVNLSESDLPDDGYSGIFDVLQANKMIPSDMTLADYEAVMSRAHYLRFDYVGNHEPCLEIAHPLVCSQGEASETVNVYFIGTITGSPETAWTTGVLEYADLPGEVQLLGTMNSTPTQWLADDFPEFVVPDSALEPTPQLPYDGTPVINESTIIWRVTVPEDSLPADGYARILDVLMANEMLPSEMTLEDYELAMKAMNGSSLWITDTYQPCIEAEHRMLCQVNETDPDMVNVFLIGTLAPGSSPDMALTPEALAYAGLSGEVSVEGKIGEIGVLTLNAIGP